jgi:Excalibur calcium-binding domain
MRRGYCAPVPAQRTRTFAIATVAVVAAIGASTAGGAGNPPASCPSFSNQADAQEGFVHLGGSPARNARGLDGDGDGVACEGLPGPYAGYATIGYHRQRKFFYGTAAMPSGGGDGFACLAGNRHYPDGPRLLRIYRAVQGPDKPVSSDLGAEARPDSGRLLWKLDRDSLVPGRYYVVFEERIRSSPYRPSECPEFRSRAVYLPRPQATTQSPRSG